MTIQERKILAQELIMWEGDLMDDCTAKWAGLMLRAEWMDEDYWWWAVYDMEYGNATVDDSNNYSERFIGGENTRQKAESIAKKYIDNITTQEITAKYLIKDTFKITGRGIVFAGYLTEGYVSIGDIINFIKDSIIYQRKIIGIEGITKSVPDKVNTGLLIKCFNDYEIHELQNWKPNCIIAIVYKSRIN